MILNYTDQSIDDLELALIWYEEQKKGLGFEFLDCVEISLRNILDFPKMYKIVYLNFRGCTVKKSPFSIFYTIEGEEIVIHPVFNNRQDPAKAAKIRSFPTRDVNDCK